MEFDTETLLSLNAIGGVSRRQLRGRNAAIDTTAETIWTPGGAYVRLTSAVAMEVVSGSANDAAAGTGARTVELLMVDGNYAESRVVVTLNGTTPVAISGTYLACNRARVLTVGSGGVNAGVIDVRTVSGSAVKRRIDSGASSSGRDADFIFAVPAGYDALLRDIYITASGGTGTLRFYLTAYYGDSGSSEGLAEGFLSLQGVGVQKGDVPAMRFGGGLKLPPKTQIELLGLTSAGAGIINANANIDLFSRTSGPLSLALQGARTY